MSSFHLKALLLAAAAGVGGQAVAQVATVVRASGQVEILTEHGTGDANAAAVTFEGKRYKAEKGKPGMRLKDGLIVKTGNESKATLIYQNGDMLSIGPDTFHIVLPRKATDGKTSMELLFGKVRAQVSKEGPLSGMEVKTRSAAMGVRGTDFYVQRPGTTGDTELVVLRGEVSVASVKAKEKPQAVKAGDVAVVDQKPVVKPVERAALIEIQKATSSTPSTAKELAPLEKKATENILKDIKATDPKLYAELKKDGDASANTYALNTAAVEQVFVAAPAAETAADAKAQSEAKVVFARVPPPEQPVLRGPDAGTSVSTGEAERRMDFAWDAAPRAVKYEFQVSTSDRFAPEMKDFEVAGTSHTVNLAPESYFWRVRGLDEEGRAGPWSETRRFSIGRLLAPLAEREAEKEPENEPPAKETAGPEPETKLTEEKEPEDKPEPAPAPAEPEAQLSGLLSFGFGGGGYGYSVSSNGFKDRKTGGGGGFHVSAAYRVTRPLELQLAAGQRGYEDLQGEGQGMTDVSLVEASSRYYFSVASFADLGGGLSYAREGLPYPNGSFQNLEVDTLEQLYAIVTSTSPRWPVMAWRAEVGYGFLGGATQFDVKKDSAVYFLVGYERKWFSFPLVLGVNLKRSERELTVRAKDATEDVRIELERTDFSLKAGYAF